MFISLNVATISCDKLPFWHNKFAALITAMLQPIILFKSEVDATYWVILKGVYTIAIMYSLLTEHIDPVSILRWGLLDWLWKMSSFQTFSGVRPRRKFFNAETTKPIGMILKCSEVNEQIYSANLKKYKPDWPKNRENGVQDNLMKYSISCQCIIKGWE